MYTKNFINTVSDIGKYLRRIRIETPRQQDDLISLTLILQNKEIRL
jgi:hypothetical protein